ncbi:MULTISPECIES: hypothetical protein [unclassified Pseudoxanthomonas]|uniref:hypothetical protein n=1 Tax=unclassified Pseudoxanthomonas TaxID=2645906 RepID=UPI003078258F
MEKILLLALVLLLAMLGTACAKDTSVGDNASIPDSRTVVSQCRKQPIETSRARGVSAEAIARALEGNEEDAWDILSSMLAAGEKDQNDYVAGCLTLFWAEVAAQNGSLPAAYEIAIYQGRDSYLCHRSKFWAQAALSRIDEFKKLVVSGAAKEDIDAMVAIRRQQLVSSLSKACPAL